MPKRKTWLKLLDLEFSISHHQKRISTCPSCFLPVLPIRWIILSGETLASKQITRSTSIISSPSSPMDVATKTLYTPDRNFCRIACWVFWVWPFNCLPAELWPMNSTGLIRLSSIFCSEQYISLQSNHRYIQAFMINWGTDNSSHNTMNIFCAM